MEDPSEDPCDDRDPESPSIENPNLPNGDARPDDAVLSELESLRNSYHELQFRSMALEETLADFRARNLDLSQALEEVSQERDSFRIKLLEAEDSVKEQEEANLKERLELGCEIEVSRARISELLEERSRRDGALSGILDSIRMAKECFNRIGERICEGKLEESEEENSNLEDALEVLTLETRSMCKLGTTVESKFLEYEEMIRKDKKQLENSIVSLTEENRDIGNLLRIALMEKEAVEKSLNKLRGSAEQKKGVILQIAERGLQRVGFGFMMGAAGGELQTDQTTGSNASVKSDGSECDEEVVSLASTVEKIMKNLRCEITELRRALNESRSDNEHLQTLVDKQTQSITESQLYIKDLEERVNMLTHTVEELMTEIKEAGEEVARWREACELEVEAGKSAIEEREKEVRLLREELERTKAALNAANNKLTLKEKLATTAMAAQAAAETTLRLADSRSVGFRERIEELTRQLEEETDRGRRERSGSRRKVRHICWPWRVFRLSPSAARAASQHGVRSRRMLPEMEALLHFRI